MKDLAVKALEGLELEVTVMTAVTRPWQGAPYQSTGSASCDSAQVSIHVDGDARSGGAPSLEGVDDEVHEAFRGTSLAIVATSTTSVVRTTQAGGQGLATAGARDHQLRTAPCFPVATTSQLPTSVHNEGSQQFSCSLSTTLVLARHEVVPEDDETDTSTPEPVIVEELVEEELPSKADSKVTTLAAPLPLAPEKKKKYVIFLPRPRNWDGRGASEIVADEVGQMASQEDDRHLLPALTSKNVSGAATKDHGSAPTASSSADADGRFASDKHLLLLNSRRRQSMPQSGTAAPARAASITWASEGGREQRGPADEDLDLRQLCNASQYNHSRTVTSQELVRQSRGGYNTSSTPAAVTSQWHQQPQPHSAALGDSELTVTYSQATPGNSRVQSSMHVQASHLQPIAMTITSSSTSEQLPQLAAQAAVLNSLSWSQAEGRINQLQSHEYTGISGSRTVCRQDEGRGDAHIHLPLERSMVRELLPTQHLRIDNTTQDTGKDETMNNVHVYGQGGTVSDEGIGLQSARSCEEIQGPGGGPVSTRPDLHVHSQADNVLTHPTQQSPVPMPIAECLDNDGRRRVSVSGLTVTGSGVLKIVSATGQEANSQSPSDHAQGTDTAADTRPLLDHIEGSNAAEGHSQPPAMLAHETSHAALDMGSAVDSGTGENISTGPAPNGPRDHGNRVETATKNTSSIVDCGQECSLATGHEAGEIVFEDRDTRSGVKTIAEAVVSTEISTQFDGVLDAVLTEHFVLVAMEPQHTTAQVHGQSVTIPGTPSKLQGEDMLNSGSTDNIQSGAKQEGKSISDDRQASNLVATAEVPSADLGAETNGVNSTIGTSGGPASTCAIHNPDAHGPDIGCAIHKPNDIKGSPTHTSTPSPLLQTRIISSHTHCPTSTSDGDANKASEASTRQDKSELGRATEAPAPLQMVKGTMAMADLSFQRPQPFEDENASTSHPTHSAPAQLSEGVFSCNENEQQLHQASQPQTRGRGEPSKSQEREGCVADQQEQSSLSQVTATQQQEDNPEGARVCKVPGPCPFCLAHSLFTTAKAKLGSFSFPRRTSSGWAANQGQSASTQHTMAGSEGGFDKSNQASSSSFVQLAPGQVLATAEGGKDRVANIEQNLPIEERANCQPERIHGNLHGQTPSPSPELESTVPVLVKPFPQGVTQTPPVETTVPPITERPQHVTSGSVEPRILHVPTNLPSEKEKKVSLCTDIPATNPDEVDTHVPTAVDSSYPKTSSIELRSSTSPDSQILASRERSQTHDGTDEKVIMEKSIAQGEPQHLITKRETENLKRIEMNPSANDQTPSPEENTTVLTHPEQNVPRSDTQATENSSSTPLQVLRDLKHQSAGKTCCYPLATGQQKPKTEGSNVAISAEPDIQQHPPTSCMDQRLTSSANTQEPLNAPPPQKDSSTATTRKIEVAEASDCILQDLGEARKSDHQDSGENLCCYPFAQKKSKSTTTDACMHDNQIGVSKSDHPLPSTTSLKEGSQKRDESDIETTIPLVAGISSSISTLVQSETEQKKLQQPLHEPRLSTCCLPVTTAQKEHHGTEKTGTSATLKDDPKKSEKAVEGSTTPLDAKNNTTMGFADQSEEKQKSIPRSSGGLQLSNCCLPVPTTLGKHHQSDSPGTIATPNDGPSKSEKAVEEPTMHADAKNNISIASTDQSEHMQTRLTQPLDGPPRSTCCLPITTALRKHHESDNQGTTATLKDDPQKSESVVKHHHQSDSPGTVAPPNDGSTKSEKAVGEPRMPVDAKNNTSITSVEQSEHTQTKLPQPFDGPQRSTCCLPVTTTLGKHHESDNQGTTATLKDDPKKSESADEGSTTPLDSKSTTKIASIDRFEDKQKNLPQPWDGSQLSTCCFPLGKHHESNSPGTTAPLTDGPETSEKEVEESTMPIDAEDKRKSSPQSVSGPQLSNCCLPIPTTLGKNHQSDSPRIVATSNDGSTKNEKTVEEPRIPADAKNDTTATSTDQSKHMQTKLPQSLNGPQRSTCCLPVTTTLRKYRESDNQGTTAILEDDPQKSESVGEGSTMPVDAKSSTNIASVHQSKDKQKNLPHSSQLSTCCLPLSKRHENDSHGTTALLRDGLEKSEKAVEESAMPIDARNNTNIASGDQSEDKQKSSPQSVGGPELSNCCLPTSTALGKHHQSDNPRTVATSNDGSTKNEKTVEEPRMAADAKNNRSIASDDQSEHMQTKLPQPLEGPLRSTCCLPVTTALRKHHESDNQGTTAALKDDPQKSESVCEGSTMPVDAKSTTNIASVHQSKDKQKNLPQPRDGLQLSTCCLPQSKRHESDSPGTTAPLRDGPEESEKAAEKSTMAIDAKKNTSIASRDQFEDKQKNPLQSLDGPQQSSGTCCLPMRTALRKSHESDNHGTSAMLKDGSKKSEKASEGSIAPRDAMNTANIPSTDQSDDKQTRLPQPRDGQRWSTCCLPVTTSLSKHHQGDNPGTSATVGKDLLPKDNEELSKESAHNTIYYPAAQIKERGLLSGANKHEPLVDASSLEIKSNHITTTTDKHTIQQKTVDADDTVHPFQGEEKGMKHQDSGGNVSCYPFAGRESKSAVEDNYAHNNQTGVSQSDHQSPRTAAINNHSKDSVEGENSHGRSFLVPKLSTCCFPSTVVEVPPRKVLETPAKSATEPSHRENEVMIARSSVRTAEVVDEDGTKRTVTSQVFLVAVDDPNSGAQSVKNMPEVQSANDKPELQTFTFHGDNDNIIIGTETKKNDVVLQTVVADSNSTLVSTETQSQQISVEDSENKQVTRRVTSITSCCIPEKSETCQRICKHFKKLKSKLLTCKLKAGEATPTGLQAFPVAQEQTVPFLEDKKEESQSLIEQEAAARAAALRQQEQIEFIERVKEATLCRKRLLERQKEDSRLHLDIDPYLQSRLCSERTKRRHKAQAAQAKREREGHMLQAREGFVTTKGWEESQRMPTNFFDALSAAARLRRRQIFLESEQGVHAFAGLAQARDNLAATKRRNRMRAATDLSVANMEATMMAKRQQKRHLQEAIWWDANTRRHRIAWEARHAGLRIMDRDLEMATNKEEERQLLLLDTLEILDTKPERESHPLETWYDNYKCGPEMVEGDGPEFTIDYLADTSDEEEEGQKIGTTEQVAKLNRETEQLMPMTVPS